MTAKTDFRIDLVDERLWHGDQDVEISNKAFQLLRYFVGNPHRLLNKECILDAVWHEVFVSEGLVKEYVHDLRLALGDNPKNPRFIETVRGRGYRFLGGIEVVNHPGGFAARPTNEQPSIVVLPFINISGDPEEEYFADGLSEEIITALSFVPWLFVIARNSSFIYKDKAIDVREVGAELGVRYVLEGSIRRSGDRLRVIGQLVDTESGAHIWADRYESNLKDVFDLQDEITEAVVNATAPRVQTAEIERATRKHPNDLTAYDLYLKSRAALNGLQIDKAIDLLDKAILQAPDYAKAKAVRAWCTTLIGWQFVAPTQEQRKYSMQLAEEALMSPEVDAEIEAYAGYTIGFLSHQSRRALALLDEVVQKCPSFAWAWASFALLESYHADAKSAIEHAETALRLNPRDPQSFRSEMAICKAHLVLRNFQECLEYSEMGLEKSPRNTFFGMARIVCLIELGRRDDATHAADLFKSQNPGFSISKWRDLAGNWRAWDAALPTFESAMRCCGIPD